MVAQEAIQVVAVMGADEAAVLDRQGPPRELAGVPAKERLGKLFFFDRLSPKPPAAVPANTCQPIWLTVRVPNRKAEVAVTIRFAMKSSRRS